MSRLAPGNLAGQRRCGLGFRVVIFLGEFVLRLLQEPILTFASVHFGLDDDPLSPKFLAIQSESHESFALLYGGIIRLRSTLFPFAALPLVNFARVVLAFGERF